MTWLVTGGAGMLGTDLAALLRSRNIPVAAPSRAELDITDPDAVRDRIGRDRPAVVVNCAAWTAVDDAEKHEERALAVNGTAVGALATACARAGARLIQMSTDYVLDGTGTGELDEDAPAAPINAYGRTKLAGEHAALRAAKGYVVRTAWLYGAHGHSFPRTMRRLARERDTVDVVDDQRGQPTWTADLAARIVALAESGAPPGIYHATNTGATTWYGLAREVFALEGLDPDRVRPTTSDRFPRPAARPANSALADRRAVAAGLPPMRGWREALHAAWPVLSRAWDQLDSSA